MVDLTDEKAARLERLEKDLRLTRTLVVGLTLIVLVMLASAYTKSSQATFDEITAQRLNIVEADGTRRVLVTSSGRAPGPIINGKEGKRKFSVGGMILYDRKGNEQGGIAMSDSTDSPRNTTAMNMLDYEKSEAVGMFRTIDAAGQASAGIILNDAPPPSASMRDSITVNRGRIRLQNPDQNAEILLSDKEGRTRIQLRVDKA